MDLERFLSEVYLCLNHDKCFPADSLVVEDDSLFLQMRDGTKFKLKAIKTEQNV